MKNQSTCANAWSTILFRHLNTYFDVFRLSEFYSDAENYLPNVAACGIDAELLLI